MISWERQLIKYGRFEMELELIYEGSLSLKTERLLQTRLLMKIY
jgi:hypothetical protein